MNGHSGSTLGAERKIGNAWAAVCVRKAGKGNDTYVTYTRVVD